MDRFGFPPRRLAESFGGPAGRGTEQTAEPFGGENLQEAPNNRSFAGSRSTGNDQNLGSSRLTNGLTLCFGEFDAHFFFGPGEGQVGLDGRQRMVSSLQTLNSTS